MTNEPISQDKDTLLELQVCHLDLKTAANISKLPSVFSEHSGKEARHATANWRQAVYEEKKMTGELKKRIEGLVEFARENKRTFLINNVIYMPDEALAEMLNTADQEIDDISHFDCVPKEIAEDIYIENMEICMFAKGSRK